ncbi:Wadjet anti-phage system protein JetA family protein [Litoribacillus peritrichatus]
MDRNKSVSLFDRVPEKIFRTLGANEHSRRNWALLDHLYLDFFSPESEQPEGDGWTQKRVIVSVEAFLFRWDEQYETSPEEIETPLNARAHSALNQLLENRWLSLDRVGFVHYVVMRPTVQSLFELLKNFAEQGPEFIGGRVQSIRNNLAQVHGDPKNNAGVFQVAARECSALLRMLNTTRMRVEEASEEFRKQKSAGTFLEKFFGDYISSLYIGDYAELFSKNHPLTARWDIIDMVCQIADEDEKRKELRNWYRKNLRLANDDEADQILEADIRKVMGLSQVDRMLTRLKDSVSKANDQALGYLEYQVRSQGDFSQKIDDVLMVINNTAESLVDQEPELSLGFSSGNLFHEAMLKLPAPPPRINRGAKIQKHILSPEQQVRRLLRQIMKGNRLVSEKKILDYVSEHIRERQEISNNSIPITQINDLCMAAMFTRLGVIAKRKANNPRAVSAGLNKVFREFEFELTEDRFENEYMSGPVVKVKRIKKGARQ